MRGSRLMPTIALGALLTASVVLPATAAPRSERALAAGALSSTTTVVVRDNFFRPRAVTIARGASVRWVNRGDALHTTTGSSWNVTLSPGESFTKRFRRAGTYRYSCTLHPGMTGQIVVG